MKFQLKYYRLLSLLLRLLCIQSVILSQENLTSDLTYFAEDSIIYDLNNNKVLLYNNAQVNYNQTQLNSSFISIDFNKTHYIIGTHDTLGNYKSSLY